MRPSWRLSSMILFRQSHLDLEGVLMRPSWGLSTMILFRQEPFGLPERSFVIALVVFCV